MSASHGVHFVRKRLSSRSHSSLSGGTKLNGDVRFFVGTSGDSTTSGDFGGTPHSLIAAGRMIGLDINGLDLAPSLATRIAKWNWRCRRMLALKRPQGWQYAESSHRLRNRAWQKVGSDSGVTLISLFQLPPELKKDQSLIVYVDATLRQLFAEYPEVFGVQHDLRASAFARERLAYHSAIHVFVRSRRALVSLVDDYGVPATKCTFLAPGPNLDPSLVVPEPIHDVPGRSPQNPLRLVTIAKDFHRKGVDRFVEAVKLIKERGVFAEGAVIGLSTEQVSPPFRNPAVTYLGMLPKGRDSTLYRTLARSHVGMLLSRAEMAGLSLLEFQAAGLVTYAADVGGTKDVMLTDTSHLLTADADGLARLADDLAKSVREGGLVDEIRRARDQRVKISTWADALTTMITYAKGGPGVEQSP